MPNTDRRPAGTVRRAVALAGLCLTGICGVTGATTAPDLDTLMRELGAVTQVEAEYREVVESQLLQQPISTSGHLTYRAPDRIDKVSDRGDAIHIAGDTLTLSQGGEQTQFALTDQAALQTFVTALRATFAGDLSRLRTDYAVDLQPQGAGWVLELRPRERRFSTLFERIRITGVDDRIERLEVQEGNGDRRTLYLHDQRIGTAPRPAR